MTLAYDSLGPESGFPTMTDPYIDHLFEQVDEYQKELDVTPSPSIELLNQIVEDLDQQWPYHGDIVCVSGNVKSGVIQEANEDDTSQDGDTMNVNASQSTSKLEPLVTDEGVPQTIEYNVDDLPFQSLGFAIDRDPWPELIGGYEIGQRAVIKLHLRRTVGVGLKDGSEEMCQLNTTADIDRVQLGFPHVSDYMASNVARENYPAIMESIDKKLEKCGTYAGKLLALRSLRFPCFEHTTWQDKQLLGQHINELVGASNERVPFIAKLKKGTVLFAASTPDNQDGGIIDYLDDDLETVISIYGLTVFCSYKTRRTKKDVKLYHDPNTFEVRAIAQILGPDAEEDSPEVEIALRHFRSIINIRDIIAQRTAR